MSISIKSVMQQHVASNIAKADGLKRESQKDLASGVLIYAAAKDPGGVALSQKFRARIQSLRESSVNIGQAQDMIQVASGATDSVGGSLQRLRDLAVRAATGTISSTDRAALQQEAIQIQESIDQVASNTEFGGLELTDGSVASVDVQVGDMQGDTIAVGLGDLTAGGLGVDAGSLSLATQAGAETAIGTIDQALDQVHSQAGAFGTVYNRLSSSFHGVQTEVENMLTAEARIGDIDTAEASAQMVRNQVMSNAGLAVMVQANTDSRTATRLLF